MSTMLAVHFISTCTFLQYINVDVKRFSLAITQSDKNAEKAALGTIFI